MSQQTITDEAQVSLMKCLEGVGEVYRHITTGCEKTTSKHLHIAMLEDDGAKCFKSCTIINRLCANNVRAASMSSKCVTER